MKKQKKNKLYLRNCKFDKYLLPDYKNQKEHSQGKVGLFGKSSLEKLTSPDQLNARLQVVTFRGWIALSVMAGLVGAIITWSILGTIPMIVEGRGIVFDPSRMILVRSQIQGTISEIFVRAGDHVEKGEPLIRVENQHLADEILEKQLLISSLESYLKETPNLSVVEQNEIQKELFAEKAKIDALRFIKQREWVIAPEAGMVLNVSSQGAIDTGALVAWISTHRTEGEKQKIYAVFPLEGGELIEEKMEAEMAIASVERDKYGLLFGTVKKVYPYFSSLEQGPLLDFPSKPELDFLNQAGKGSGVIVEIEPNGSPHTFTGYRWSSKNGPPFPIREGSLGTVKVVLRIRRPISFLIPHKANTR